MIWMREHQDGADYIGQGLKEQEKEISGDGSESKVPMDAGWD